MAVICDNFIIKFYKIVTNNGSYLWQFLIKFYKIVTNNGSYLWQFYYQIL